MLHSYVLDAGIVSAAGIAGTVTFPSSNGGLPTSGNYVGAVLETGGSPYEYQATLPQTGQVPQLPVFSWEPYGTLHDFGASAQSGDDLYPGTFNIGVACVTPSGVIDGGEFWNLQITFSASSSDPSGFTWTSSIQPPPSTTTSIPSSTTTTVPSFVPISGAGSTWSANAVDLWIADEHPLGLRVNYAATGSTDGRSQFLQSTVDFAVSDLPFQSHPVDGSAPEIPSPGTYGMLPVTAGGLGVIYNLAVNGQRITNLRLTGQDLAKIFTGQITNWDDPTLAADNPGLQLPNESIIPVVRSDGAGTTEQLTAWMADQYPAIWSAYCTETGHASSCGATPYYPTVVGMVAQNGDLGVAAHVSQSFAGGAIGYVSYPYSLNAQLPDAKILNASGYYVAPDPDNVSLSLLQAEIDTTDSDPSLYLTEQLHNVYVDPDPRAYPLSYYGYMIVPTKVLGSFSTDKGKTLSTFANYGLCHGQQEVTGIGYAPLPVNLVEAGLQQIARIPGAVPGSTTLQGCQNPTFDSAGHDLLTSQVPMPPSCDKQGPAQCASAPTQLPQGPPLLLIFAAVAVFAIFCTGARRRMLRGSQTPIEPLRV